LACLHAFAGLWTVGTDYLTKRTLGFVSPALSTYANLLRKSFEFFFIVLGFFLVIFYLLIIWS
jgi:succinate dehydrogenase hydrophobic anchor subunit